MDFDLQKDFNIFDSLLKKRPEIIPETLKTDLTRYYLPYLQKLVDIKKEIKSSADGVVIGVSAIQGTGKTTQGEILEVLLGYFGYSSVSQSIDDHYITHEQLCNLRTLDPRFIRRGVTHDILLAKQDLKKLKNMHQDETILISGYDKGAHHGDGERFRFINPKEGLVIKLKVVEEELVVNKQMQHVKALQIVSAVYHDKQLTLVDGMGSDVALEEKLLPKSLVEFFKKQTGQLIMTYQDETMVCFEGLSKVLVPIKDLPKGWKLIDKKPDFIFYDGWMVGARSVDDESVFDIGLPALETKDSREFAKLINKKLLDYVSLWDIFDFLTVLYVPNYEDSLKWRDQAEEVLRAKGEGMNHEEIKEFVYYFWRSVHPGIHIKNLAQDTKHTSQVVIINDDHTVKEVLSPQQVISQYP